MTAELRAELRAVRRARALRRWTGVIKFVLAGVVLVLLAYILSWRLLWDGLAGSDSPYHLDLANWVASSFPRIASWYRWDAAGLPYGIGYPLAAHWLAVALSRVAHFGLSDAMQVIQFAINPLCALGVYAFCAWRLKRPFVGMVAGSLYLLSPIAWTFLVDWGFYANQAGTVLFMPILIALDVFFEQWASGARGWRYRLSAIVVMALTALIGFVSPAIMGAPLLLIPAYVFAVRQGGARLRLRWLLVTTPVLAGGAVLLALFWAFPLNDYLHLVASRQPRQVYSPDLIHLWSLDQVLQLHPMRTAIIQDRTSLSPAVWIPALAGGVAAFRDGRIRVFLALIAFGLLSMTMQFIYAATFDLPLFYFVTFRSGMLYLQFLAPLLAAVGLVTLPQVGARSILERIRVPARACEPIVAAVAALGLAAGALGVSLFALHVQDYPHRIAYGAFEVDVRDLWNHHKDDPCVGLTQAQLPPLCQSRTLLDAFSITELVDDCRDRHGTLRAQVPICAALKDIQNPQWSASVDGLVASTLSWCTTGADPVCTARFSPLAAQLLLPTEWRPPTTGCHLDPKACASRTADQQRYATLFPSTPQRAVVDAHVPALLQSLHDLVGGGQAYGYNTQLLPSPELDSWMMDNFLTHGSTTVKNQLAQLTGADAVVLDSTQMARAAEYQALGWTKVSSDPLVYVPPEPSGLAAEWPSASSVLVVGTVPETSAHPYNDVFEQATEGVIPFSSGWLVRGRSSYIDDYSATELSHVRSLLLLGYRYHDAQRAWALLDQFVTEGGRLYVETGWQYLDPDWQSANYDVLPVADQQWGALDPQAPVVIDGRQDPKWGPMTYQGGGWGASSAASVRNGAQPVVSVAGRVVVARWTHGNGRVVWSGMNLMAHATANPASDERQFLAEQWSWLLASPTAPSQMQITPRWLTDDSVALPVSESSGPVDVLFKESIAPGWSAQLVSPGGTQRVQIDAAELDYMLVHLDRVPAGAQLIFRYGPTLRTFVWWSTSIATGILLFLWLLRPALALGARRRLTWLWLIAATRLRSRTHWDDEG